MFLHLFSFALLQLLKRSAADIVREDTDREMATFLMVPLAPPDPCVQALFFELDSINLAVVVCGRNCGRTLRMGSTTRWISLSESSFGEDKFPIACLGPLLLV